MTPLNASVKGTTISSILATNGYSDKLFSGLSNSIIPLVPIQIATGPLETRQIAEILPLGHTVSDTRRAEIDAPSELASSRRVRQVF